MSTWRVAIANRAIVEKFDHFVPLGTAIVPSLSGFLKAVSLAAGVAFDFSSLSARSFFFLRRVL